VVRHRFTAAQVAIDIWVVTQYVLADPNQHHATAKPGKNRDVARRAALDDSHNHLAELRKVVDWVLFVADFDAEDAEAEPLEPFERLAVGCARRLDRLLDGVEHRSLIKPATPTSGERT
jgi:hypothetical protein